MPRGASRKSRQSTVQIGGRQLEIRLVPLSPVIEVNESNHDGNHLKIPIENTDASSGLESDGKISYVRPTMSTSHDSDYDRYGFFIGEDESSSEIFHKAKVVDSKIRRARIDKEALRSRKWAEMLGKWNAGNPPSADKLKERIKKGIPNDCRDTAWYTISQASIFQEKYPIPSELTRDESKLNLATLDDIERDIDRTFPRHRLFVDKENGVGPTSLRNILRWYSAIDPEVGYCQGMGFLAGLFVVFMEEKRAFYTFCAAMQLSSEVPLRNLYLPSMAETQRVLYVYGELGKLHLGKLWRHLLDEKMHPTMYATDWLMTMFCRGFSFDLVTRVMDVFLKEGYKIVYRVSLALIKNLEKEFLEEDFEGIMHLLRRIPELTDADTIMELAYKIPVKRREIERFQEEFAKIPNERGFGEASSKALNSAEDIATPRVAAEKKGWW
jgi:TBC1 domain family member 10